MALQKGLAEGGISSSTASNDQVLQAESPHNSENQMCPICLDIINNQVSVSWCSHAFCFPCILEWSRNRAVCPICREPFRYLLRKVGDNNYEVYSIGHYTSSARYNRGRRVHHHSAERRWHHSTGHRHRRSSSDERSSIRARDWGRDRSRSRRRSHDSHSRGQQTGSYDPSSSRRWQHSRAHSTASETSRSWDQATRHERDVPVRMGRSEHRQRAQWESRATGSRSRQSRWRSHTPEGHRGR
ncbi:E3 ubiquitin-protein ligase Topors-like [Cyanistes caeruleus]|uniref:E3 ubiquitin-protein ligase Topors-like n=1 Tax=Cyanistes caeruleus TaxID=156563 RepID=UPI000CDB290A|nr:E3 ubiquitin-protein ligase Topors-like [Cyanistes caeruleus]